MTSKIVVLRAVVGPGRVVFDPGGPGDGDAVPMMVTTIRDRLFARLEQTPDGWDEIQPWVQWIQAQPSLTVFGHFQVTAEEQIAGLLSIEIPEVIERWATTDARDALFQCGKVVRFAEDRDRSQSLEQECLSMLDRVLRGQAVSALDHFMESIVPKYRNPDGSPRGSHEP